MSKNMNSNKSFFKSLIRTGIKLAGLFFAVNAALVGIRTFFVFKKMKELTSEDNQMHTLAISNGSVYISPSTKNAFFSFVSALSKIEFEGQPVNQTVNIDLFYTFSKVTLIVPKGADIVFSGDVHCEKVRDLRQDDDGERLFKINLHRSGVMSELVIECI